MDCKTLVDSLREVGSSPYKYSGRAMYGRSCPAVDGRSVGEVLAEVVGLVGLPTEGHDWLVDDVQDLVRRAVVDSMGTGVVVYWPHIKWDEAVEDDED